MKVKRKPFCVYLDRDGVINSQEKGFVNKPSDFELLPGAARAIKMLNDRKIMTIIVTNQGGIEAGHMTLNDFNSIMDYMDDQLKKFKAKIDHIYYCKSNSPSDYFRKPNPGMISASAKELKLENHTKYMIGDRLTDMVAGKRANCTTILVRTGFGKKEEKTIKSLMETPDHICNNLLEAVYWIYDVENL